MQDPHEAVYRTAPPAQPTQRLDRNIRAVLKQREEDERSKTAQEKISQHITNFAGSLNFVFLHVLAFGAWIVVNLGFVPGVPIFDPTFAMLAMIASVEAIFVTTFVLISQNRMARDDARRADLNLQISLLAEQEATRLLALVSTIAEHLDVKTGADATIDELATEITPEQVLHRLDEREAAPRK
ncbi:DUF1003 domain-containing protein [Ensifer sp. LCM 4579]|uniref:DUF1003 domain-containing protein n=1 Tax=Ensifer sp. LCM 4579 TaxID=1848292 RepID=UPI0008D9A0C7|nr:DUF1003 domain-containing protein [Ensifer sp. LCM 4579]OHV81896.1 hypothetical protein LCM4579_19090 [Ensifer sp. LCM 4579]